MNYNWDTWHCIISLHLISIFNLMFYVFHSFCQATVCLKFCKMSSTEMSLHFLFYKTLLDVNLCNVWVSEFYMLVLLCTFSVLWVCKCLILCDVLLCVCFVGGGQRGVWCCVQGQVERQRCGHQDYREWIGEKCLHCWGAVIFCLICTC